MTQDFRQESLDSTTATLRQILAQTFEKPNRVNLGQEKRVLFESSMEPAILDSETSKKERLGYPVLIEYKTKYPEIVVEALQELYLEYRNAFIPLIEKNREWETDYQYCFDKNGVPIIYGVQIDMQPLMEPFLEDFSLLA